MAWLLCNGPCPSSCVCVCVCICFACFFPSFSVHPWGVTAHRKVRLLLFPCAFLCGDPARVGKAVARLSPRGVGGGGIYLRGERRNPTNPPAHGNYRARIFASLRHQTRPYLLLSGARESEKESEVCGGDKMLMCLLCVPTVSHFSCSLYSTT